ncbi:MAG TPA: NAD(P)/FAD-dependent oxidoreductase [Propioniciclava sp.]|jgi:NADH dehydrogenase|uniref:NAD(P)/FAD-dependent oxidoreductase n=1 Tax=Propioniciclava sp. TaxID=2038686 RepID=UPI002C252ED1|nr:NAD(P)/FAD-dependent oxidoreductase [Propioniciclava sp.]HRL48147.1 NAD(P)/FAD-dependent oxidoreductase [Propioniciclava sp.]HRL79716.1 NAD(P)/FAD-dependent oxidoreductase [Propioniciclava sp.]
MARERVVIIGSGFGGLFAAKALRRSDVDITLVSKTPNHLFQPLLYQVATGILSEGSIAPVARDILRRQANVRVETGLVTGIDATAKVITQRFHDEEKQTSYDRLIVAAGAGQSYFGHDEFETFAPGMKTIDDALELRARIFWAFEMAEVEPDPAERARLLTFVVVGAGPTGVEMAGQIRELASTTLAGQFRTIDPRDARVVLIDGSDQVLGAFGPRLGAKTQASLERKGVEVVLNAIVTDVSADAVVYQPRDVEQPVTVGSRCKVWAAGVRGSELGAVLSAETGCELDRAGRVVVTPELSLPNHPEISVIGDLASVPGVPGVAQGAIQEAKYVAERITHEAAGRPAPSAPFAYFDKGSMATISKFSAVVKVGKIEITGFLAWAAWLFLHLLYIAGFKSRITTLLHWFISFLGTGRTERVSTNQQMVGRLALESLGQKVTGKLLRGEKGGSAEPRTTA